MRKPSPTVSNTPLKDCSMVHKNIVYEFTSAFSKEKVQELADRNGEYPFGFIIDYIKDMYQLSKPEGWDTAMAICEYYAFN